MLRDAVAVPVRVQGVPTREIAAAIGRALLGWTPTGPTLIEDLEAGAYSPH